MTVPRALNETLTLRRTLFAVFVAAIMLLLTGGVMGFATAADSPPANVPETFGVDSPRVGDFANYTMVTLRRQGDGSWLADQEKPLFSFEWLPATTIRDAQGTPRLVHSLRTTEWHPRSDGQLLPWQQLFHYEVSTDYLVAVGLDMAYAEQWDATNLGVVPLIAEVNWTSQYTMYLPHVGLQRGLLPFCGIHNLFQGTTQRTVDAELAGACSIEANRRSGGATETTFRPIQGSFDAVAWDRIGSWDALVFQQQRHGRTTQFWLNDAVPYPLQFAFREEGSEEVVLIRLHQFQQGASALLTSGTPSTREAAPSLKWAPREAWGPSDAGTDRPFSLSEAFRYVTTDPDGHQLREFRATHPGAVVVAANYVEQQVDATITRGWQLQFADQQDEMVVGIFQTHEESSLPIELLPETTYAYRNGSHYNAAAAPFIPADRLPDRLPTVASMIAVWEAYADDELVGNSWGVKMECVDEACARTRIELSAGHERVVQTSDPTFPAAGDQTSNGRHSFLIFEVDETTGQLTTDGLLWQVDGESGGTYNRLRAAPPAIAEPASAEPVEPAAAKTWAFPTNEYALGAGAFALIVGFVYWLWPAIRHVLGLGLFTRLERPTLLDHPLRQEIVSLVEHHPGIHFAEIVRRVGGGNGNVDHHLRQLVSQHVLATVEAKGFTCYYVPGAIGADTARALPALKSRGARQILEAIASRPGLRAQDVARRVGMSEPTVHYHVTRLREVGLVESKRGKNGIELTPTASASSALAATA